MTVAAPAAPPVPPAYGQQQAAALAALAGDMNNNPEKGGTKNSPAATVLPGQVDKPAQQADVDPPGAMVDALENAAQPEIDALLASVKAMLGTADDFQDAQRKLVLMFGEMDTAALAGVLANGILAANLAGRDDITNGR